VAAGGAVGALGRALLAESFPVAPGGWPWSTLVVNVAGSLLLGGLLEALARSGPDRGRRRRMRFALGTGVLGGFTTYSTFAVEIAELAQGGHLAMGVVYGGVSVVAGVLAAMAGIGIAAAAHRRRAAAGGGGDA
jgi:CrcB protein